MRPKKRILLYAESERDAGWLLCPLRTRGFCAEAVWREEDLQSAVAGGSPDLAIAWMPPPRGAGLLAKLAREKEVPTLLVLKAPPRCEELHFFDRAIVGPTMAELLDAILLSLALRRGPKAVRVDMDGHIAVGQPDSFRALELGAEIFIPTERNEVSLRNKIAHWGRREGKKFSVRKARSSNASWVAVTRIA
jgi:hypothetical protein